jgi:hypothetical protein
VTALLAYAVSAALASAAPAEMAKPRVIVISDIGNEPDDQMSLVRLLLYANELDIEGLIASTSTWQKTKASPNIMKSVIAAYGKVRPNLMLHAQGWPTEAELASKVHSGQPGYGLAANGPGKMTAGAQAIIDAADKKDLGRREQPGSGAGPCKDNAITRSARGVRGKVASLFHFGPG